MKSLFLRITNRLIMFSAVVGLFIFAGCSDDDEGPTQTVWEIISSRDDLSAFAGEMEAAGFMDDLNDANASVTVFAPNNTALNTLLTTLGQTDFSNVSESVVQTVLSYHVVNERIAASEVTGTITTSQGEDITVGSTGLLESGASGDSEIILSVEGTNGVVHIISTVMVPPSLSIIADAVGTSAQVILLGKDFSILAAAIQKVDATKTNPQETITGALIGLPTTVFAIPNAVFEGAGITVDTYTAAQWEPILRRHILPKRLATLPADATEGTLAGTEVTIDGDANPPTVSGVTIIATSAVVLENGAVYPIAGMIQ